jgi:hypothetical protein
MLGFDVIKNWTEIKIAVHLHTFLTIKRQIPRHFDPETIYINISRLATPLSHENKYSVSIQ